MKKAEERVWSTESKFGNIQTGIFIDSKSFLIPIL